MNINLKSGSFEVTKIVKKTKARGFVDLAVGDVIEFSCNFMRTTGASRGNYALDVGVRRRDELDRSVPIACCSQNELFNRLACFELKEL